MKFIPLQPIPSDIAIDFLGKKWLAFGLSIFLILGTCVLLATRGLNYGIDFSGGIVIAIRTPETVKLDTLRTLLSNPEFGEVSLQHIGSNRDILIRLQAISGVADAQAKAIAHVKRILAENVSTNIEYRKVDYVGPQVGRELIMAGALSLALAFAGIAIYIWLRFELQYGIGALLAIIHDGILTIGFYSLFGIEFNLTSVAAILTVIGYSVNDSVVIYDRIRENLRKYRKMPLEELLNSSLNSTLSRTILTAGSVIAALVAFVLFGGEVIRGFSLAMLFGVLVGTYSSIYISAPVLIFINPRQLHPAGKAA